MDEVEIVRNVEDAGFVAKRRNMHYDILGDPFFRDHAVTRMLALSTARAAGGVSGAVWGGATGAAWAHAVPPRPAATTSASALQIGARKRAAMETETRVSVIIIRETIGGWRRLTRRARRGI